MKKNALSSLSLLLTTGLFLNLTPSAWAGGNKWWDTDGNTSGAGGTTPGGSWEGSFWSTDSNGASATGAWTSGDNAVFAAGSNATGTYTVTMSAAESASELKVEEGTVNLSGTAGLTLFSPANIEIASGKILIIDNVLTGSSGFVKTNAGKLVLNKSTNTFTGTVKLLQGTVEYGHPMALGVNSPLILSNATLRYTGATTGNLLEGSHALTLAHASATIEVANSAAKVLFTNSIGGTSGLTKEGPGILVLSNSANNTYTGTTDIKAGGLKVLGANNVLGTGSVTIAQGASLMGTANIPGTINVLGTIAPGTSPGTLSSGTQNWASAGTYLWEVNQTFGVTPGVNHDLLNITGTLNITATTNNPFIIKLATLTSSNTPGALEDFYNGAYDSAWTLVQTTTGITGFDPARFVIDSSGFSNPLGTGFFLVTTNYNGLELLLKFVHPTAISSVSAQRSVVMKGQSASFQVDATFTSPYSYQWQRNGANMVDGGRIYGSSGSGLSLSTTELGDSGDYRIIVSGAYGTVTSAVYHLEVLNQPSVPDFSGGQMVGWWKGESNALDAAGYNNGTALSNVTYTAGKVGLAFDFNNTNRVKVETPSLMDFGYGDFTVEGWVKTTSTKFWNAVCSFDNAPSLQIMSSGKLDLWPIAESAAASLNDGNWHHVAVVQSNSTVYYYADGSSLGTGNTVAYVAPTRFWIGWDEYEGDEYAGQVDELSLYGKALSLSQLQTIYNAGEIGKSLGSCVSGLPGQALWYTGDDNAHSVINTNVAFTGQTASYDDGVKGGAFSFNGQFTDEVTDVLNVTSSVWSAEMWVNPSSLSGAYNTLLEFGQDTPWFGVRSDGEFTLFGVVTSGSDHVPIGEWSHLAYTWDGAHSRLYRNGQIVAETTTAPPAIGGSFGIGVHVGDTPWQGLIDEVGIYTNALLPSQVQSIYSAYSAGKCAPAPTIAQSPNFRTNNAGTTSTFTVVATGAQPLAYQWYRNGSPIYNGYGQSGFSTISGADGSTLTLNNVFAADAGSYSAKVTGNGGGEATSGSAYLWVMDPYISQQPSNRVVAVGQGTYFSISAEVSGDPIFYKWKLNGVPVEETGNVSGITTTTLTFFTTTAGDSGTYTCDVTAIRDGTTNIVTSQAATLTVVTPPTVNPYMFSVTNLVGTTASLAATVGGTPPFFFRWTRDGNPLTDARYGPNNSSTLTISNVTYTDEGLYVLTVSNMAGTSGGSAHLSVIGVPVITNQPANLTNVYGQSAGFYVGASGGLLSYQWYKGTTAAKATNPVVNGGNVTGADFAYLFLSSITSTDALFYRVVVSNQLGRATSAVARLTVRDPGIIIQPENVDKILGGTAMFSVYADGTPTLNYQWKRGSGTGVNIQNGPDISGANSDTLIINNVTAGDLGYTNYWVVVSNGKGSVTSTKAVLKLATPPVITRQPTNMVRPPNGFAFFSVGVTGSAPRFFQWWKDGSPLSEYYPYSGATSADLYVNALNASNAGDYYVIVSNEAGHATSTVATLVVSNQLPTLTINPTNHSVFQVPATFNLNIAANDPDGYVNSITVFKDGQQLAESRNSGNLTVPFNNLPGQTLSLHVEIEDSSGDVLNTNLTYIMPAECVLPPSGVVAWWRGEDDLLDFYGANDATTYGNIYYVDGMNGRAFDFDGYNTVLNVGYLSSMQIQNLSIETWVRRGSATEACLAESGLSGTLFSGSDGAYELMMNPDGSLSFGQTGGGLTVTSSLRVMETSFFHHVGVTKSNDVVTFYVDGIKESVTANLTFSFDGGFAIGSQPGYAGTHTFYGAIDEMAVYNRPLGENEMVALFRAGSEGKCTDHVKLVASNVSNLAGDQRGLGIAVAGGFAYVAGVATTNVTGDDGMVARFATTNLSAAPNWSVTWPGLTGGDHFNAVAVSTEGVYVAGDSYGRTADTAGTKDAKGMLVKFPTGGTNGAGFGGDVWDKQTPRNGAFNFGGPEALKGAVTAVEAGQTYVYLTGAGQNRSGNTNRLFVSKMRSDGSNMWTVVDAGLAGTGTSAAGQFSSGNGLVAWNGAVYVAGRNDDYGYAVASLRKYAPNGTLLWTAGNHPGQFNAVTVHAGYLYAVGYKQGGNQKDFLVEQYDENGNLINSAVFDRGAETDDLFNGVVGLGSRIYAVGSTYSGDGTDLAIAEIKPDTLEAAAIARYRVSLGDVANGVSTDGKDLYVVGESRYFSPRNREFLLLRYEVSQPAQPLDIPVYYQPVAEVNRPYNVPLQVVGGRAPYNITAVDMPPGLFISTNGLIAGTPTTAGVYYPYLTVTDSSSPAQTLGTYIEIDVIASNSLPTVAFTAPVDGAAFTASGTVRTASITANDIDGYVAAVAFYINDQLIGTHYSAPFDFDYSLSEPGSYILKAVAYDNYGGTATAQVHVRINALYTSVLDFEPLSIPGTARVYGGLNNFSNYLAGSGITLSNLTAGATLVVEKTANVSAGNVVKPSSGTQFMTQRGVRGTTSYAIKFGTSVPAFGFTRVGLLAGLSGVIHPDWRATAYDSSGNELGAVSEAQIRAYEDVPARSFVLSGPDIKKVVITADDRYVAQFNSPLLDDLTIFTQLTNSPPVVNITAPSYNASFTAPASVTVAATAYDTDGSITQLRYYLNGNLTATEDFNNGNATNSGISTLANLAAGTYALQVAAVDDVGAVRNSSPVPFTVSVASGVSVINFDALDAAARNVGGTALSNYLAGYGVRIDNVTRGARVEAFAQQNALGGEVVAASSPANLLSELGVAGPVSFTLRFDHPVSSVQFTRPKLLAGSTYGATHPQWTARAFDTSSLVVAQVGEDLISGYSEVAAQTFSLVAPNISWVRFESDGQRRTAFNALALDDLIINTNAVTQPLQVAITSPTNGATFTGPLTIPLVASATNLAGSIAEVRFEYNGVVIGSVTDAPYELPWENVQPGTYSLRATVVDTAGNIRISTPVTISVVPGVAGYSTIINFDELNANSGPVTGGSLFSYLTDKGIAAVTMDAGTELRVLSQTSALLGGPVEASSSPNLFTQAGLSPLYNLSFTLTFSNTLTKFQFTRPKLKPGALGFVSHPGWYADAYDAAGNYLATASDRPLFDYSDVPAQTYVLEGQGIKTVVFSSYNYSLSTAYEAVLLDDLVLTRPDAELNFSPAVAMLTPVDQSEYVAPATLNLSAYAYDDNGVTNVSFYLRAPGSEVSTLLGSTNAGTAGVYSLTKTNLGLGRYFIGAVATDGTGRTATSPEVEVKVRPNPRVFGIVNQPTNLTVALGETATFFVEVTDVGTPAYQWRKNGTNLVGRTDSSLTLTGVTALDAASYRVFVSSGTNSVLSEAATLTILTAPVIVTSPVGQGAAAGESITLTVVATGSAPLHYQWLLNGNIIPDATRSSLMLENLQPYDAGNYRVVVYNGAGSAVSDAASIVVLLGSGGSVSADNFADRAEFNPIFGAATGNNADASKETGEPNHAGRTGGKSIWYSWTATFNGVITLTTRGSSFDTLLAVYTGDAVTNLTLLAASDDFGGNQYSEVTFNCIEGTEYIVAVDGYYGAAGNVVVSTPPGGYRVLDSIGSGEEIPSIISQTPSTNVVEGQALVLQVVASGPGTLFYQWSRNDQPILDATNSSFTITSVDANTVGGYSVLVINDYGSVASTHIQVEIGELASNDKFFSAVTSGEASLLRFRKHPPANAGPSRSFTTTQIFSTVGATKDEGEPNHCGVPGGHSSWYSYVAPSNGTCQINTDGSSFNTVIAVYTGPGFDFFTLNQVTCDNSSSGNGGDRLSFTAAMGTTYFIAVDGVGGASGNVRLNINLGTPPTFDEQPVSLVKKVGDPVSFGVTVSGSTNLFYQWRLNGANIAGATNSTLNRGTMESGFAGAYTVAASNLVKVVLSSVATLDLEAAPAVSNFVASRTVTAGTNVTLAASISGSPQLVYQWYRNGEAVVGATGSTLPLTPVQTTNAGDYYFIVTNTVGIATSSVQTLTVLVPAPTIVLPKEKASFTVLPAAFSGTALTTARITSIQYQVTDWQGHVSSFQTATGTGSWSANVTLGAGTNIVAFKAVDASGQESALVTRQVFYSKTSVFTLVINGVGSASGSAANGASLVIGLPYKLQAKALDVNWLFTNWTENASNFYSSDTKLTFQMTSNLILRANFIPNPFVPQSGRYFGLMQEEGGVDFASAGYLAAKVTGKQGISGKVFVDGDAISFSTKFDLAGAIATKTVKRDKMGKPPLLFSFTMGFSTNRRDQVIGTVQDTNAGWTANFVLNRSVTNDMRAYSNTYTMVIPGAANAAAGPSGAGYATVSVDGFGKLKMAGALPDGTPVKQVLFAGKNGEWPFFAAGYASTNVLGGKNTEGMILGALSITTNTPAGRTNFAPQGGLTWIKRGWTNGFYDAGFTNSSITVLGSRHLIPGLGQRVLANLVTGKLAFVDGNLPASFTNNVSLSTLNVLTVADPNPNTVKPKFDLKKGLIKGAFVHPGGISSKPTKFNGVVLQDYGYGRGLFLGTNQAGPVKLDAN